MWESLAVSGGPTAIVALTVVSLVRGWLIPRSTHSDRVTDLKETITAQKATIAEKDAQISILLGRTREPV